MKKRWVALLLLSGCIAWPTTGENPQPTDDGSVGTSDGGTVSGDGPVTSACPGGVVVRSMAELQELLADLSSRAPDNNNHVFCLEPAGAPYSLSAPLVTNKPTLGNVYFSPIAGQVTVVGLGREPADTVIAGANPSGQQPTVGSPRCPVGSARFFFVSSSGHLTLSNLTLQGGCIQGARGGDAYNGAGGGGGSAGFGGAVAVWGGKLTLDRVAFKNNIAIGGLGGISKTQVMFPPGGGGGGAGLDTEGRGGSPDGNEAPMPTNMKFNGANGGGASAGGGATTGDGGAGSGSSGGGGGAGITGTDMVKAGIGGAGGGLGGGGGGGGAATSTINPVGGSGGTFGLCGGGGGSGLARNTMTMAISTVAGGGGAGYGQLLGVAQGNLPNPICGDPGEASTGMNGGFGGSGWGAGGAIFFAGGMLTIMQLDPAAQTGNVALVPQRNQIKSGLGNLLFAVGSENMPRGVDLFAVSAPATANNIGGITKLTCKGGACAYSSGM